MLALPLPVAMVTVMTLGLPKVLKKTSGVSALGYDFGLGSVSIGYFEGNYDDDD